MLTNPLGLWVNGNTTTEVNVDVNRLLVKGSNYIPHLGPCLSVVCGIVEFPRDLPLIRRLLGG